MRVMTCNVWVGEMNPLMGYFSYAWPGRMTRQVKVWLEQNPDVICLQEVFLASQRQVLRQVPGYTLYTPQNTQPMKPVGLVSLVIWVLLLCSLPMLLSQQPLLMLVALVVLFYVLRNHAFTNIFTSRSSGSAILVKNNVRVLRTMDWVYTNQAGDFVNNYVYRGGMSVDVELPDATTAQIITTHLNQDHTRYRMEQVEELLTFLTPAAVDTVVVCGDFNATPESPDVQYIQEQTDLRRGDNTDNTWNDEKLLDHIFTNATFQSYQVLPLRPTLLDHSPIVADI